MANNFYDERLISLLQRIEDRETAGKFVSMLDNLQNSASDVNETIAFLRKLFTYSEEEQRLLLSHRNLQKHLHVACNRKSPQRPATQTMPNEPTPIQPVKRNSKKQRTGKLGAKIPRSTVNCTEKNCSNVYRKERFLREHLVLGHGDSRDSASDRAKAAFAQMRGEHHTRPSLISEASSNRPPSQMLSDVTGCASSEAELLLVSPNNNNNNNNMYNNTLSRSTSAPSFMNVYSPIAAVNGDTTRMDPQYSSSYFYPNGQIPWSANLTDMNNPPPSGADTRLVTLYPPQQYAEMHWN